MGFLARAHETRAHWSGPHKLTEADFIKRAFSDGAQTDAGIAVSYETAFTYSAVFDAVNQIASDVAKMPLNHMRRRGDGGAEQFTGSNLYRLLKYEPNREMGSMVFRRTLQAHALTSHGGYAEIERDGNSRPVALWPLTPDRVRPTRPKLYDRATGAVRYGALQYEVDDGKVILDPANVLHIRGLGYDPHAAYSIIDKARQAIGLALSAEKFGAAFFGNGTAFGGILTAPEGVTDDEELEKIRKNVNARHRGVESAHQFLLLYGGLKYDKTGTDPQAAQMDALRNKQVEEVARFYRMPPHRLGVNTPGTVSYSSVEMANLDYYTGCLLDWITIWEEELNRKLIPSLEARQQFIKHNANVFLRGDIKSRYDALGVARDKGIINADEWRELEDWNPQPNGQGKLYLVQQAQVPLDRLGALIDAEIKSKEAKAAPSEAPTPPPPPHDAAVRALEARLEAADRTIAELRASLDAEREQRQAAEHRGEMTARELEQRTASERHREETIAYLQAIRATIDSDLTQARAQAERAEAAQTAAETEMARSQTVAAEAEAARVAAVAGLEAVRAEAWAASVRADEADAIRARAELAQQEADQRAAEVGLARDAAAAAQALAEEAQRAAEGRLQEAASTLALVTEEAQAATSRADAETASRETAEAARQAAETSLLAAHADLATVRSQCEQASERLATVTQQAEAAQHEAGRSRAELNTVRADLAAAVSAREAAEAARASAEQTTAEARSAAAEALASRSALETRAVSANEAQVAANEALRALKTAEDQAAAGVMASHRTLVEHIMRLMIERETDRARRAQGSPEKLRGWIDTFYDGHAAVMIAALKPAVQVHLAWTRATDDAHAVTDALVAQHIADSRRQLQAVVEGDAGALAGSLAQLLQRWESDRPAVIAGELFAKEMAYVQRRRVE